MADIFLSYSRADRPKAQQIAEALEAEGFSVWWDKVLRAGQTYDEVTEGMLRDSRVVVVLWSEVSVKSKWVRAEATLGERTSAVVPAMIEDAERPILFELTQTADLIGWDGDRQAANWRQFIDDLQLALDKTPKNESDGAEASPSAAVAPAPDATIENTFWTSIENSDDPADFQAYLKRYPTGHFADLANIRLGKLESATVAPVQALSAPPTNSVPQPTAQAAAPASSGATSSKQGGLPVPAIAGGVIALLAIGALVFGGGGEDDEADAAETIVAEPVPVEPESSFADCDVCPQMVIIEAGSFMMGSPATEVGRTGNETPLHEVQLAAFAIGETEVTFDEWDACLADGGCGGYAPQDRGYGRGGQPVIGVSWGDASAYARWLSGKTGKRYRLPTEAQWEYAARGGTTTPYWWGAAFAPGNMPMSAPVPAASLAENPFGLKGMLGNAREWVEDCYINNYNSAPTDGSAQLSGDCNRRILRGGAWGRDPDDHRAANRARIDSSVRDRVFGFRLVTDVPASE